MAELRASPVVNPSYKRIADVLANLQGPMGEIIPFTDANPFKFLMPAASTFENLAYGNSPLSEYAGVTNRRLPIVKTGRENELTDIADVALMASGLPMASRGVARGANYLGDVLTQATRAAPPAAPMRAVSEIAEAAPITPKPLPPEPVRSDIGFYSQLEAATNPLQDKGTGDQFLSQLQKSAGVKPDEIKYTGLDEFLKGKKAVTKAEIQGYLASNKVDVQEVRLGGQQDFDLTRLSQLEDEFSVLRQHPIDDPNFGEDKYDEMIRLMNIRDQSTTSDLYRQADDAMMYGQRAQARGDQRSAENFFRQYELLNTRAEKLDLQGLGMTNLPKFSQHKLPGGENYRELLLTLPDTKGARLDARRAEIEAKGRNATDAEKQEWSSIMNQLQPETRDVEGLSPFRNRPEFRTTHFDQPNILAHMRVNDRTVDGKKTLFIEEIQSDWHQKGRKKGYQSSLEQRKAANAIRQDGYWEVRDQNGEFITNVMDYALPDANAEKAIEVANARIAANRPTEIRQSGMVPDAPFKTTWHELSLKRAIQEASEKGYDQIAFTTGKTQAERYDLSKQVDYIDYKTTRSGPDIQYGLAVVAKNGDSVDLPKQFFTAKELPDIVGKEVADKIIAGQGQPGGGRMTLRGLDLKVGGEGMKGFYDQILPKSLEKLGKKFDAKVGKTQMDGVEVWQMDITPKMRESVTTKGQPLFSISGLGAGAIGSGFYQDDTMEQLSR
jgi:hypothetical protein